MDKIFDKWCEKLLDTGKGNRLINFKDSQTRTLDILLPDYEDVFKKISNGEKLSFYDVDAYVKRQTDGYELFSDYENSTDDENANNNEKKVYLSVEKVKEDCKKFLLKKQILAYKQNNTLKNVLKTIKKIALDSIIEKGINILYITFGMLCWKENEKDTATMKSPLILIPINIEKETTGNTFTISEYEDEYTTNPTLIYKLKNEYNIELPEFRQGEFEEETLADYFLRISDIAENNKWKIENDVKIGTFSFLKIDMYKDLKNNKEKVLSNPIVKKLLSKDDNENIQKTEIDEENCIKNGLELELHNVVDADSSQMAAILQAKSGNSFVLQGPPGTGKSQTITNLIAEFLFDGKKILFVSEKLAALNVVYNNLKKAGLSDFCLELHSSKTNKKEVINELYRILSQNKKILGENAEIEVGELKKYKTNLDNYANTIHKKIDWIGKTPYEIMTIISETNDAETFDYSFDFSKNIDDNFVRESLSNLEIFYNYTSSIGYDYKKHSWFGYKNSQTNYQNKLEIKKNLNSVKDFFTENEKIINNIRDKFKFDSYTLNKLNSNIKFIEAILNINIFSEKIFEKKTLNNIVLALKSLIDKENQLNDCSEKLFSYYNKEIFEIDINEIYLRYKNDYTSFFRFLNSKYKHDKKILKSYQCSSKKISYNDNLTLLKVAKTILNLKTEINEQKGNILKLINIDFEDKETNLNNLYNIYSKLLETLPKNYSVLNNISNDEFIEIKNISSNFVSIKENFENIYNITQNLQKHFDSKYIKLCDLDIDIFVQKISDCIEHFDELENWERFCGVLEKFEKLNIKEFVDKSIENNLDRTKLSKSFLNMLYTQIMYKVVDDDETLREFTRTTQDLSVSNFKKKDKLKFEISKAKIISKASENMPSINNIVTGNQVSLLVREVNKKNKQKPVRLLLKEIGQLVQTLKPCFLMSPLSVSSYLDPENCQFDVVIFDEASQIFPWDSIGAIYRAKQVIIVGDSKQMPPSNFFNAETNSDSNDEEDFEDDSLDFESILDLSSSVINQKRLNWHYRSKTEELIAFSNKNYYDNTLVTFPSAFNNRPDMGIDFYYVENGIFNRSKKTNKIEAEKVVDLVFEHFKVHPERSIGVVAFSISQQEEIENTIQKRRDRNDEYAKFFDSNLAEPFFVKNLETVQGDERDTIIFSVAYGYDENGKFLHNFGPLNKKGGERRLNVAVTRAKYNVKLVSSIKSIDIDLSKSSAVGTKMLKEYLDIAEHGVGSMNEKNSYTSDEKYIEKEIADFLIQNGYDVQLNIGCSEYKIDIGVRHPENVDFFFAIECDGSNYKSSKTTRDRDRLRQEVLEKLGWNFYRVWSVDWFLNKAMEKKKLLSAVKNALDKYNREAEALKQNNDSNDSGYDNTNNDSNANLTETAKDCATDNLLNNEVKTSQNQENNILQDEGKLQKKEKTEVIPGSENVSQFIIEKQVEKKDFRTLFSEYEEYDIFSKKIPTFNNSIIPIIKTEQPITEEYLIRKVLTFFDKKKVTNVVRELFAEKIGKFSDRIFKIKDYYVVDKDLVVTMRVPKVGATPRDILMISDDEIESGMLVVIKNSFGITERGLFLTMANLLGFSRIGSNIELKFKNALSSLYNHGKITFDGDEYFSE